MADIKDKEYSLLKENLENLRDGAIKYQAAPVPDKPLPSNIVKKRYEDAGNKLIAAWKLAQNKIKEKNDAFDALQLIFKECEQIYNADVRMVKGIYGIYSENLRDFGISPEKKRTRIPKVTTAK